MPKKGETEVDAGAAHAVDSSPSAALGEAAERPQLVRGGKPGPKTNAKPRWLGLSPKGDETRGLHVPANTCKVRSDNEVNFHRLWAETNRQVDSYAERVRENRDVMQALDFARYVLNCGVVQVLEPVACDGPLKVDPALLRWKAQELARACQERFRLNDSKPHLEALQLQSIHEKLNQVAGYLSRLVVLPAGSVRQEGGAGLRVISGGLEDPSRSVSKRMVLGK